MKKVLFLSIVALLLCLGNFFPVGAQEGKTRKISVKITEGDKIIADTVVDLKEGQDPEDLKRVIADLAGSDLKWVSESPKHHSMMYFSEDDDTWTLEEINVDSIKEAHPGKNVIIIKDDKGDVTVKEIGEGDAEEGVYVFKSKHGDKDYKGIVKGKDEEGEPVVVKEEKMVWVSKDDEGGEKTIIITEGGDKCKESQKKVKVIVESGGDPEIISEDDVKWISVDEDDGNVEVYIIKNDDEIKVVKKAVKVEVKEAEKETPAPVKEKKDKK